MADGWRQWIFRDGRLRTPWRALLFVALLMALVQLGLLLVPGLAGASMAEGRLPAGLTAQHALMLVAALLAGWIMLRWVDREPAADLGFPLDARAPLDVAAGLGIGAAVVAATVLTLTLFGGYRYVPEAGSASGWLAVAGSSLLAFAIPAAAEEAVFRGYLLRTLADGAGAVTAVAITSVLFALVHGANPNVTTFGLLNIVLAGVLLAVAVLRTGSLWLASGVHLGWNWVMAGPLDLPVSGLESYDVPFYDLAGTGPAWLTGGAFGPEGGLAGTAAALAALVLVVLSTRPGARFAGTQATRRERVDR